MAKVTWESLKSVNLNGIGFQIGIMAILINGYGYDWCEENHGKNLFKYTIFVKTNFLEKLWQGPENFLIIIFRV